MDKKEFYEFIKKDESKEYALFMPAIGLGLFNGDVHVYWNSMIDVLKKNNNLLE